MYPNQNYGTHVGGWDNPLASTYAQPIAQHLEELSKKYPAVSSWVKSGRVTYLDRSITFTVPAGATVIQAFNVTGGYDALVFDRKATVVQASAPSGGAGAPVYNVLANEDAGFVEIQVSRKDAAVDVEQQSVNNCFGFGWEPYDHPQIPEFWSGADIREFTLINNTQNDVKVVLTLTIVLL